MSLLANYGWRLPRSQPRLDRQPSVPTVSILIGYISCSILARGAVAYPETGCRHASDGDFMPYESGRPRQPIDLYVDCVVLTSFLSEIAFLRNVCKVSGIRIRHAESLDEADFLL